MFNLSQQHGTIATQSYYYNWRVNHDEHSISIDCNMNNDWGNFDLSDGTATLDTADFTDDIPIGVAREFVGICNEMIAMEESMKNAVIARIRGNVEKIAGKGIRIPSAMVGRVGDYVITESLAAEITGEAADVDAYRDYMWEELCEVVFEELDKITD